MVEVADLETRIKVLEEECQKLRDIQAITKLKSKYLRCIDKKLWDEIRGCFTEDVTANYGPRWKFQGIETIVEFLNEQFGSDHIVSLHQGHNPEIEMTSGTTAAGTWQLYSHGVNHETNTTIRIGNFYEDEYAKENGEWKIRSIKIIRMFMEAMKAEGTSQKFSRE